MESGSLSGNPGFREYVRSFTEICSEDLEGVYMTPAYLADMILSSDDEQWHELPGVSGLSRQDLEGEIAGSLEMLAESGEIESATVSSGTGKRVYRGNITLMEESGKDAKALLQALSRLAGSRPGEYVGVREISDEIDASKSDDFPVDFLNDMLVAMETYGRVESICCKLFRAEEREDDYNKWRFYRLKPDSRAD